MNTIILDGGKPDSLLPISSSFQVGDIPLAGISLGERLARRFTSIDNPMTLSISPLLWPSEALVATIAAASSPLIIKSPEAVTFAWLNVNGDIPADADEIVTDPQSLVISYPWHILAIAEKIIGGITENLIEGTVRERVTIDGFIELGEGSVILPGVYIEGNVIIGKNSKIGPNCYIRGNSCIGDSCHIGQAVEVKNSIIMNKVAAGHLSYIGDSIVCPRTNFGAGTIISNFRHDGGNHHSMVNGKLVDTGRRKFGAVIGEGVHTGIHTSIYCGRKIWAGKATLPGEVVRKDIM